MKEFKFDFVELKLKVRKFSFVGVKGVIRNYRSAQELKADTLTAHALGDSHLYTLSPKLQNPNKGVGGVSKP